jgi:hypothetical protein
VLRRRGSSCQVGVWTGEKTGFGREKKRVDEGKGRLRSRGSSWDRAWVQMLSACAAVAHFDGVRVVWVMDGSSALASVRGGVHEVVPLWGAVLVVQCEVKCVPRFSLQGGGGAAFPCDVSRAKPGYMLEVALKPCLFGWRVGLACAIWPRGGVSVVTLLAILYPDKSPLHILHILRAASAHLALPVRHFAYSY